MTSVLPRLTLLAATTLLALATPLLSQDFDYGDSELSPEERYDEALMHLYGADEYKKSRGTAIARLKEAASRNYAPAHNMLGLLQLQGNGFFASPRKALRSFEEAAALGDTLGQYNAGYAYLVGRGTRASMAQAEKHFLAVVDEANRSSLRPEDFGTVRNARASAYFFLGLIYADEDDPDFFDATKATDMLHKADALNEPGAAMLLAIRYAKGEGAPQDQEKSVAFLERYKLAAVNKLHNSVNQVLFQGMDREAIKDTLDELVSDYEDEMTERIQAMQTSFGVTLLDDPKLFSPEQAFVWLLPVAVKDNPVACSRIATLYHRGEGGPQDYESARRYLELSYKRNSMAKYNLAVMLANAQGGPADLERAKNLMRQAANDSWYPAIHYNQDPAEATFITERNALALVKEQAIAKEPAALYCYGRRLLFGIGVDKDFEAAKSMILEAADLGNVQARYFYGVYIAKDTAWLGATEEDKAIQAAADAGYPPAIHFQGQKAENSFRYNVALERYQQAAALDHSPSLYKLGKFYRDGLAVERDYAKAVDYFRKAVEFEDSIGYLNLGLAYEYGVGVEIDCQKAYELYEAAIDLGSYYANYCMGNLLASGKLGLAAWEEAVPYWEKAADFRVKPALLQLGDCYREGNGVPQNLTFARNYYYGAFNVSRYGDNDTTYRLAQLQLMPQSDAYAPKQALADLRLLELQGYPQAGYQLGIMNMYGRGLNQNAKKAYSKFLKASQILGSDLQAELGDAYERFFNSRVSLDPASRPVDNESEALQRIAADACYHIARILLDEKINKTSPADAVLWYEIAARRSHPEAQLELGKLYLSGKYVPEDSTRGWGWVLKSATRSDEARFFAAKHYFEGSFTDLGETEAVRLLRSAAASGHQQSLRLLESKGYPLEPDTLPSESAPSREGQDDGFDGPVDLDVA